MLLRTRWVVLLLASGCGPPAPVTSVDFEPGPPPPSIAPRTELPPATTEPPSSIVGTDAPPDDPAHHCDTADDCVLVTGSCGAILAANRAHAVELQAQYAAIASVGECAAADPQDPVDPMCEENRCTTRVAVEADARACEHDRDCQAIQLRCHWVVASRTTPDFVRLQALASGLSGGPTPDCVGSGPPEAACRYHYCSRTSDLVPAAQR